MTASRLSTVQNNRHPDDMDRKKNQRGHQVLVLVHPTIGNQRHFLMPTTSAAADISVSVSLVLQLMLLLVPGSNTAPAT